MYRQLVRNKAWVFLFLELSYRFSYLIITLSTVALPPKFVFQFHRFAFVAAQSSLLDCSKFVFCKSPKFALVALKVRFHIRRVRFKKLQDYEIMLWENVMIKCYEKILWDKILWDKMLWDNMLWDNMLWDKMLWVVTQI